MRKGGRYKFNCLNYFKRKLDILPIYGKLDIGKRCSLKRNTNSGKQIAVNMKPDKTARVKMNKFTVVTKIVNGDKYNAIYEHEKKELCLTHGEYKSSNQKMDESEFNRLMTNTLHGCELSGIPYEVRVNNVITQQYEV